MATNLALLACCLFGKSWQLIKCEEEADIEIVRCVVDAAKAGGRVNVVADDTDVAILLLYHWNEEMADVTFISKRSKATFDIKSSLSEQSHLLKPYLLVLHTWTSCDTMPAIHSKGKTSELKKLEASQHLRNLMDILGDQVDVSEAGMEMSLNLYDGNYSTSCFVFSSSLFCHERVTVSVLKGLN